MNIKFDFSNKRTIGGLIILVCVMALIFYSPNIISLTHPDTCIIDGVCQHEERVNLLTGLVPVFILVGIIIGVFLFFWIAKKLDEKQKDINKVSEALIKFLNKDEKLVVKKIIENNGKVLQSEISRIDKLGKLKSHRVVQRLIERGVIEKEAFGKTNIIKLNKSIADVVLEKK